MAASVTWSSVSEGDELPSQEFPVQRVNLVMYAGASGDFNVIHWNERVAMGVGLSNVIAHGMFTMAEAIRVVTDWVADPGAIVEYGCRFTRPVPVPDDDVGAVIHVTGNVVEKREDKCVVIELRATCDGVTVLGRARAVVRLA